MNACELTEGIIIDFKKFIFKCDNDDCKSNTDKVCCVCCKSHNECYEKGITCSFLDIERTPEFCDELYLKRISEVK